MNESESIVANQSLCIVDIMKKIPHRYPFLLIDKVGKWTAHESIEVYKNVTINEPYFQGHFPGQPVMPGVLIIEALAQAAGILAYLSEDKSHEDFLFYLAGIENARFKQMVVPGDQLRLEVKYKVKKSKFWKVFGQAFVGDKLVCCADLISAKGIDK